MLASHLAWWRRSLACSQPLALPADFPRGTELVRRFLRRELPAYVDGALNVVDAEDVARGHLAAAKLGVPGERYILGGDDFTLERILRLVAEHVGRRASTIRLPHWSVYPLAVAAEALAIVTKREPRVTLDGVRMSTKHMYFSSRKAQRELEYRWRDPRLAIAAAVDWFKANGYY